MPLDYHGSHILEHLLGLVRKHAEEDNIALGNHSLVVELNQNAKLLLEGSEQVGLPRRHEDLQTLKLV